MNAERSIYDMLPQVLNHDDLVIVEIGAAMGDDTSKIISMLLSVTPPPRFRYIAFEPEPRNIGGFLVNASCANVELVEACVGDDDKYVQFMRSGGVCPGRSVEHTISGSVKRPVEHLERVPWCTFNETIRVRMTRLDTEMRTRCPGSIIDFIWCDCQGAEDLVLAGGQKTFARTRYFYTEYYDYEMYEGQLPLEQILERLPGWYVVELFPCGQEQNALLRNTTIP